MGMYTIAIVFDKNKQNVLMLYHLKQHAYNFPGGNIEECENEMDACYRELFEETGIKREDVDLHFVRLERVTLWSDVYSLHVATGVLKRDVQLVEEINPLHWVRVTDRETFLNAYRDGNAYTFLLQAIQCLDHVEEMENAKRIKDSEKPVTQ